MRNRILAKKGRKKKGDGNIRHSPDSDKRRKRRGLTIVSDQKGGSFIFGVIEATGMGGKGLGGCAAFVFETCLGKKGKGRIAAPFQERKGREERPINEGCESEGAKLLDSKASSCDEKKRKEERTL